MRDEPVYLDHQATTPVDPRVFDAMEPYFSLRFGNPHSRQHRYGWEAEEAVEKAREQVAAAIGAAAREIVFTSGATESNNLAIKGVTRFQMQQAGRTKPHIVTASTEHKCVLESCAALTAEGARTTVLPVTPSGLIDLGQLAAAIGQDTVLVSIMAVNNEIGVIQPLAEIGALCREHGVVFHTDAAQAVGKIEIDVEAQNIDLLSISGHKLYGPMGVGALYVRRRPRVRLDPLFSGGGQERGFRSGTLPAPLCVGLGAACAIANQERDAEHGRLKAFRDRFLAKIQARIPDVVAHGDMERRIAGNLSLGFDGVDGEALMNTLNDVAISTGSACTSASVEPSYVLQALGMSAALAGSSVRIGFGRFTTDEEVDYAAGRLADAVDEIRAADQAPAVAAAQ